MMSTAQLARFELRPADHRLIEAAIGFGDWLARHPDTTPDQVETIRFLQAALRRLPEDTPGVDAAYDYTIWHPDQAIGGVVHGWTVSLWRHRDPGAPGQLEIFSTYTSNSYWRSNEQERADAALEHDMHLMAGAPNRFEGDWGEFIEELTELPTVPPGATVEIEAERHTR